MIDTHLGSNSSTKKIYLGNTEIKKIYYNNNIVYSPSLPDIKIGTNVYTLTPNGSSPSGAVGYYNSYTLNLQAGGAYYNAGYRYLHIYWTDNQSMNDANGYNERWFVDGNLVGTYPDHISGWWKFALKPGTQDYLIQATTTGATSGPNNVIKLNDWATTGANQTYISQY